jgi:hypothetical protein
MCKEIKAEFVNQDVHSDNVLINKYKILVQYLNKVLF